MVVKLFNVLDSFGFMQARIVRSAMKKLQAWLSRREVRLECRNARKFQLTNRLALLTN